MASLNNFIKARRIQVSFVAENFKPNGQTHVPLSGSEISFGGITDTARNSVCFSVLWSMIIIYLIILYERNSELFR